MNSEVTLEQLRELKAAISAHSGKLVTKGNCTGFAIIAEEKRFTKLCEAYVRQLLTTPPASGEVVGVPREPTREMFTAGAEHVDETMRANSAIAVYRAMLSAAPKQAMGWRDIESAPRDGTRVLIYFAGLDHVEDATITEDGYCLFDGESFNQPPTHWQPLDELPSPPEKAGG